MTSFDECPNCGREATEGFSHNYFPVYKCLECGEYYCEDCSEGDDCPSCGLSDYCTIGKVYA